MTTPTRLACYAALLLVAPTASAQTLVREAVRDTAGIPRGMMPPAGKCRVWVSGVPATRQPAPTDCATALRQKPANARVIYGPNPPDIRNHWPASRGVKRDVATPATSRRPPSPSRDSGRATPAAAPARTTAPAAVRTATPAATRTDPPPRPPDRPKKPEQP